MADSSVRRNALIDLYGDFGPDMILAREVWGQTVRDAKSLREGRIPDNYHNDMTGGLKPPLKGGNKAGPQLKQRAAESIDEFLHCPDNAEDRELWAMLGFGLTGDELARRVGG
jgi:hypothetical protein